MIKPESWYFLVNFNLKKQTEFEGLLTCTFSCLLGPQILAQSFPHFACFQGHDTASCGQSTRVR